MENKNGILTGYNELDALIGGLCAGDLVVIGSRPSVGKTAFCLSLVKNITIQNKIASAFFSLEMSTTALSKRLLSQVDNDTELVATSPFYINDNPNMSMDQLKESIREMINKNNVKIVFVDYLGLVSSSLPRDEVFKNLKSIALEFKIVLVGLYQFNGMGNSESPVLNDIPETLQKEADIILLLHREKDNEQKAGNPKNLSFGISVAKNRIDGKTGIVKNIICRM